MTWIIDRFEGGFAVAENTATKKTSPIPITELPDGVREGDVLVSVPGGYIIDAAETAARKERAKNLLNKLKNKRFT